MAVVKNKTTEKNREFWSYIEEIARQVSTWPKWMQNERPTTQGGQEASSAEETRNDSKANAA